MAQDSNPSFRPIILPEGRGVVELCRCDDAFLSEAGAQSIPIQLDSSKLLTLARGRGLGLAQIYAALTMFTGPSGEAFDDWKGAFAFPFKLTVRRDGREARYLLLLRNVRSLVQPTLYRLKQPGESFSSSQYHPPFADELSEEDLERVTDFIRGFCVGFLDASEWTTPFVKEVRSNLILFGYHPEWGGFFERAYKSQEAYDAALAHLRRSIPEQSDARKLEEFDS